MIKQTCEVFSYMNRKCETTTSYPKFEFVACTLLYFISKNTFDYLKITLIAMDKHIKIFPPVIVLSSSNVHVFKIALV